MKNIITVALGVVLGLIVLSALPGFAYYAAYFVGQLWYSGSFLVLAVLAAIIGGLLWRDRVQARRRIAERQNRR